MKEKFKCENKIRSSHYIYIELNCVPHVPYLATFPTWPRALRVLRASSDLGVLRALVPHLSYVDCVSCSQHLCPY